MSQPMNRPVSPPIQVRELMARHYTPANGYHSCVRHGHLMIDRRPADCQDCRAELMSELTRLADLTAWLNDWIDDARDVLTRQDASLQLLVGWETSLRQPSHLQLVTLGEELSDGVADVTKANAGDSTVEVLMRDVLPVQADRLLKFFGQVLDASDGTRTAAIENEEGRS